MEYPEKIKEKDFLMNDDTINLLYECITNKINSELSKLNLIDYSSTSS